MKRLADLKSQIKDHSEEVELLEHILTLYPDAEQAETRESTFRPKGSLNFVTYQPIKITNVQLGTGNHNSLLFLGAYHNIDSNIPEALAKKYSSIRIHTHETIIAHHNSYDTYVIDCKQYVPFEYDDISLKNQHIFGVKKEIVQWIIDKNQDRSWGSLQHELKHLPEDLREMIKNHFIVA